MARTDRRQVRLRAARCTLGFVCGTLLALLMTGCASPVAEKKVWDIVWPLPPEEPKVKFVEVLQTNKDVEASGGLGVTLFGEDVTEFLIKPYGVAVDREGRVYVTEIGKVAVFDKKNKKFYTFGTEAGSGKLRQPIGVAISADGRIFVTDVAYDRVFMYDAKGSYMNAIGRKGEFDSPSGVAIDNKRQRIYVTDSKKHNLKAYSLDGDLIMTIGERGEGPGQFNFPTNLTLDAAGNIYVVDTGNFRVQIFDPEGKFIKSFGKLGDALGDFSRPKGIAIDSEGHIYVVDAAFENFQIFDKDARLLLYVGEGGTQPGQFSVPAGIFVDHEDKIYVADQLNARVQVFQYLSDRAKAGQESTPQPAAPPQPAGESKPAEQK